jgi:hypothetical protein
MKSAFPVFLLDIDFNRVKAEFDQSGEITGEQD